MNISVPVLTEGRLEKRNVNVKNNVLGQLQDIVGGYIQTVNIPNDRENVLVVDEEGLIKQKRLNKAASFLVRNNIVGNAVIFPVRYL